jgi:hypothetical protein
MPESLHDGSSLRDGDVRLQRHRSSTGLLKHSEVVSAALDDFPRWLEPAPHVDGAAEGDVFVATEIAQLAENDREAARGRLS